MEYKITIFKNIHSTSKPYIRDVNVALERIRSGEDLELINQIRFEKDKAKRNLIKQKLPSILFSGEFSQRNADGLKKHSGLIAIDFDNFKDEEELLLYRKAFIESKEKARYTFALFTSPSGNGLKVIVKIPAVAKDHQAYFQALQEFYNDEHFDKSCKDICRVCYSSYDEKLYHNPESEVWVEKEQNESYDLSEKTPVLKLCLPIGIVQNLQTWFNKKFSMNVGEKNNNLFVLCSAFNDFGLSKHECEQYVQGQYGSKKTEKEISNIVKSAYKKPGGTKFFEDKKAIDLIERQMRAGTDRKKIYKKLLEEGNHTEEDVESAIKSIADSMPISEFWYFDDKGKCKIRNYKFKAFLEQQGFYKLYPEGAENFIFVKVENNMIEETTPDKIKDFVLEYLLMQMSLEPYETMASASKMFKDDYLNLIDKVDVAFYEENQEKGVVYFRNGAALVKTTETKMGEGISTVITKNTTIELIDYLNLNGYVWRKHIIDRDYVAAPFEGCVFDKFIGFIGGGDPDKILSIKSTIGYLMHSFKTSANNKAVILNDETISDNPNGGSGKGIFCAAIGHMKRLSIINGKTFDANKSFAYQTVDTDTQVLVYDDIPKNFVFENLFSVVTEGITLEKKNRDAIKLTVGKSPKIVITTNYTIGGVGGSAERRKWEIEFSSYFSASHTPLMEFGHQLFDEWNEEEWSKFNNLMIDCLRIYLEKGLVKQAFKNLVERKFIRETSFDFHEWVTESPLPMNQRITKPAYFETFIKEFPDYNPARSKWFSHKTFSKWLNTYGEYKGYKSVNGNSVDGRWIIYISEATTKEEVNNITKEVEYEEPF